MHIMTLYEMSVSSAWIISFTSFGSFAKLLSFHSKIVNHFEKYYSNILLGNFNMATEFMFFKNPWQYIKFINKYGITIPNILSKLLSPCLEPLPEPTGISLHFLIENLDNQYRHNFWLWYNNRNQHFIKQYFCSCLIKH